MRLKTLTASIIMAFTLSGCVDAPDTADAKIPEVNKVTDVLATGAATVNTVTRIGSNDLYEITPESNENTTCFMLSSIFTGSAVSGDVECVEGKAVAGGSLTIKAATGIGDNTFYEVTPATRPDLDCYISASIFKNSAVSGSIKCMSKNASFKR